MYSCKTSVHKVTELVLVSKYIEILCRKARLVTYKIQHKNTTITNTYAGTNTITQYK